MKKYSIGLNIFTNSIKSAPSTKIIKEMYYSFLATFGSFPVYVYCDTHPNKRQAVKYINNLKKIFPVVIVTDSLSDGYIRSITDRDYKYLFQCEHDWIFTNEIYHGIFEILEVMERDNIWHLSFNKRANNPEEAHILEEKDIYTLATSFSNRHHIINREYFLKNCMGYMIRDKGSKGIWGKVAPAGLVGAVYGKHHHPATVIHLDGRKS